MCVSQAAVTNLYLMENQKGIEIMRNNERVRNELILRRVRNWELANRLGINEATLSRRLRVELPEEEQDRLIAIIQDIQKEGV